MKLSSSSLLLASVFASSAPALGMDIYREGYFAARLPTTEMTSAEQDYFAMCLLDSYNALPDGKATLDSVSIDYVGPIENVDPGFAAALASDTSDRRKLQDWPYNYPGGEVGSRWTGNGGCNYCNDYDDDDPFVLSEDERQAAMQRQVIEDDEPKHQDWAAAICSCLANGPFETLQGAHDCALWIPKNQANGYYIDQENDVVRQGMFHGVFQSADELSASDKAALGQVIVDSYNELHSPDTGFTMKTIEIGSGTHGEDSKNDALPWYMQGSSWTYEMTTTAECLFCTSDCNEDDDMVDCGAGESSKKLKVSDIPPQPHHLMLAEVICTKLNQGSVPGLQKVHGCIMWYDESVTQQTIVLADEGDSNTPNLLRGVAKAFKLAN